MYFRLQVIGVCRCAVVVSCSATSCKYGGKRVLLEKHYRCLLLLLLCCVVVLSVVLLRTANTIPRTPLPFATPTVRRVCFWRQIHIIGACCCCCAILCLLFFYVLQVPYSGCRCLLLHQRRELKRVLLVTNYRCLSLCCCCLLFCYVLQVRWEACTIGETL